MSTSPLGLFGPISDVQGFSMRDGKTHLEIQRHMRKVVLDLVAAHNTLVGHLNTRNADLSAAFANLEADLQPTVDQLEAALVTLGAFNSIIAAMQATVASNAEDVEAFGVRLTTAEGTLATLDTRLDTAEGTLTTHETRLDSVEESVAGFSVTTETTNYATMAI